MQFGKQEIIFILLIVLVNCVLAQTPTWAEDIAPIIYTNCSSCHHEGTVAPFNLMSYEDVLDEAEEISLVVEERKMPPWPADPNYRHFKDEKVLSDDEIQLILDWIDDDMPTGDLGVAPDPPVFPSGGSMLETIDLTIAIPPYTLQYDYDEYRWFAIENPFADTFYVNAIEVIAGLHDVVHHCDISWDISGISLANDLEDPLPGFNSNTGAPNYDYYMNAWMSGGNLIRYPENWGIEVPPGAVFVLEIHYGPEGQGLTDTTKINLEFAPDPEEVRPVYASWLLNNPMAGEGPLTIPANEVVTFHQDYDMTSKKSFITICPHMHLLGQSYKVWFEESDGDSIPLINIPKWQFHWQKYYTFQSVQVIKADARIKSEAVYDNTTDNPENPNDPPQTVHYGATTHDEMYMTYFLWTNYKAGDEDIILDSTVYNTAVYEEKNDWQLNIYPNPVRDYFYLTGENSDPLPDEIMIINSLGVPVKKISLDNFQFPHKIVVEELSAGIYFVEMISGLNKNTSRIIIL
ncbi:MAG: T9SS type A sorting domain-containing protein [Chitinophagales bacterium]